MIDVNNVEIVPTWDMSREDWLRVRRNGIGGSDAATTVGIGNTNYGTAWALWHDKLGLMPLDDGSSEAARWGTKMEPVTAEMYAEDYKKAVVQWKVIIFSKEYPWMFANIDYWEVEASEQFPAGKVTVWESIEVPEGLLGIIECKTSGIASHGSKESWGTDANPHVPETYIIQTVHYGIVTGFRRVVFAACLPPKGLVVRELEWDENLADQLISAEEAFWTLVEDKIEPEIVGGDATDEVLNHLYPTHKPGKEFDGGPVLMETWTNFLSVKAEADALEKDRKTLRATLLAMIGDAEIAKYGDKVLFTAKSTADAETFDKDSFKKEYREIYDKFVSWRPGARRVVEVKEKAPKPAPKPRAKKTEPKA